MLVFFAIMIILLRCQVRNMSKDKSSITGIENAQYFEKRKSENFYTKYVDQKEIVNNESYGNY